MRYLAAIGLLALMIIVCGCTGSPAATPTPASATATVNPATPVPSIEATPTIAPTIAPITIAGSGDEVTPIFRLESGLSIFKMKYDGSGHFVVEITDQNGNVVAAPANALNSYDGSKAEAILTGGDYNMNVQSSGPWSVVITQPRPAKGDQLPLSISGNGPMASNFMYLDSGLITFYMSYSGLSDFRVELLDQNGKLVNVVTSQIGSYKGSQSIRISQPGLYLLNIEADGSWKIDIS